MAARKRALAALAAGALLVPLVASASPAYAEHIDVRTTQNACPTNQLPDDPFEDVDEDNTFNDEITCIAEFDVTTGTSETEYSPENFVIRVQMAQFIARILRQAGENLDTSDAGFTDIGGLSQEARDSINGLANADVVRGTTPTTFSPRLEIRRDQMASFIAQAQTEGLDRNVTTSRDFFTDDEGNVHEDNINIIASEGITIGRGGDFNYDTRTNVTRQQMAAFLARKIDILVAAGIIPERFGGADLDITLDQEGQEVGTDDVITGEVTGENVDTVSVTGDCITNENDTDDTDANADGVQFEVEVLDTAAAGECEITVTVTFTDNNRSVTETFTVDVVAAQEQPGGPAPTTRPELIDAEIVGETASSTGTTVRFTFDEEVTGTTSPIADRFQVFTQDGQEFEGTSVQIESGGNSVLVTFSTVNTTALRERLTVATVDEGAVTDNENERNPIGDAQLGTDNENTTGFTAGVTEAPDLRSVQNFRPNPASSTQTLVDFVFDENAFVTNPNGFSLILTSGDQIQCAAVSNSSTTLDTADFVGDGTTTITVACNQTAATGPITADEVARGIVQVDTVNDADQRNATGGNTNAAGNSNPLQASDTPDGSTPEPDLVSATLTFNADQSTPTTDTITFTFDEAVTVNGTAANFFAFDVNGDMIAADSVVRSTTNANQVIATFADGELDSAVGASVTDGAVVGQTGTAGRVNEEDEVGVANNRTSTDTRTAGRTNNPDLTAVRIQDDAQGNTQVVFVFDEALEQNANQTGSFSIFQPDGTQLRCTALAADVANNSSTTDADNEVICTAFQTLRADGTVADPTASEADIRAAVLGTVDDDAVRGSGDTVADVNGNPDGAELATGGAQQ